MKRDMDLVRLILLKIEEEHISTAIYDLKIEGYSEETVAYHCQILHNAGYLFDYAGQYASGELYAFGVGGLTWAGHEYLERIRDNSRWGKIKKLLTDKGLPFTIDMIKTIADAYIGAIADTSIKGIRG